MKPTRQLSDVLAEYRGTLEMSKKDLDSVPAATRGGFGIAINQAKANVSKLKIEYLTRILEKSIGCLTVGDREKSATFAKVANKVGDTFTLDAEKVYRQLADRIWPSIGRTHEFSLTQVSLLDQAVRDLVADTGYVGEVGKVKILTLRIIADFDDLIDYVRELVVNSNGTTVATVAAQNDLLHQALDADYASRTLAAVVVNSVPADRAAFNAMFTRVLTADVDSVEEVDEKFARLVFEGPAKTKAPESVKPSGAVAQTNQDQE